MENRTELQKEYLQLINKLNASNRMKNQQTELSFLIRTDYANSKFLLCTTNLEYYLCIAKTNNINSWIADADFEYQLLAKFILKNVDLEQLDVSLAIVNSLRRLFSV